MIKKHKKKRTVRSKPRMWIISATAAGIVFAFSAGKSRALNVGFAEGKKAAAIVEIFENSKKPKVKRFDIPSGTLGEVIDAFQRTTGWRITIPEGIKDISSPGVIGDYTEEQALKRILQDTGVTYLIISPKNVSLKLQGPAETVDVADENSVIDSPKYTEPLRDIPQTINVIDKESFQEQGATTLREVLKNVPGLTVSAGEGGNPAGDNLTLRGFSARNDIYIDGSRDLGPQTRDPFNLEQVEIVKGPASTFSGRGATGGTINLVSKTPAFQPAYDFSIGIGNATRRITGDINTPLDKIGLGERNSFRFNFMVQDSEYAGRDVVENDRWGIAPTLLLGFTSKTNLTLSYFHLDQENTSDYGIPWVPASNNVLADFRNRPAPVPRDTFYGYVDRDLEKLKADLATITLHHVFNDNVNLRNQFRYGFSTRDSIATPPRFNSPDSTEIKREMRAWLTDDKTFDNQTDLSARFNTGLIAHSLVFGTEFIHETNIRKFRSAPNALTTLLNPDPFDVYTGEIVFSPVEGDITANTQSVYLFDTAKITEKFELTGGLRFDRFEAEGIGVSRGVGSDVSRVDKMLSYRLGAVYKPVPIGSIYVSYGTSFSPSLEGLSYRTADTSIAPEETYTFEAGTKWELFANRLLFSGAVFSVNKNNARTVGLLPGDPPQVLEGKQRVNGLELSATGNITRNWSILTGYSFLDSEIVESNNPNEIGNELPNTPKNSFNLWTTYEFPFRLSIGGGARFVDKRFNNTSNTRFVDEYWLIDATASYRINKFVDIRLNLNNLADKYYFDRVGGGHIVPGPGREILFTTNLHF